MKIMVLTGLLEIRLFLIVWTGQLVSIIGSSLTTFALDIWIYEHSGSINQYIFAYLCTTLPSFLISPVVGALVDRWNRRWTMILSDSGTAVITVCLVFLLITEKLEIWHIYLLVAISSIFSAFQFPAYAAATTQLVPKEYLSRASGLIQLAQSAAQLISPALAAFLLGVIQLKGIILIDLTTFLLSLFTLLFVRFPEVQINTGSEVEQTSLLQEITYGWNYLAARAGLLILILFHAITTLFEQFALILLTPKVLSFGTIGNFGTILSVGGMGIVVGSLIMTSWEGLKRRTNTILLFTLLRGLALIICGFSQSVISFAIGFFFLSVTLPEIHGSTQVILQKKVALNVQGRVFALDRALTRVSVPISAVVSGPLVDQIFEPLITPDGLLAATMGQIIGVGSGHGIALFYITLGILIVLCAIVAYPYAPLRQVEDELPDVIVNEVNCVDLLQESVRPT